MKRCVQKGVRYFDMYNCKVSEFEPACQQAHVYYLVGTRTDLRFTSSHVSIRVIYLVDRQKQGEKEKLHHEMVFRAECMS
jgi:hypothetical protein